MMHLALLAATILAALVQVGVLPSLFAQPVAAPLLPIALVAAWGLTRSPSETAPSVVLAAVILGVTSEDRVGWYLLALIPTAALLVAARLAANTGLARVPMVAAAGTVLYLGTLLLASGTVRALPAMATAMLTSALLTALLAVVLAIVLGPLRPRPVGLFE